MPFKPGQSGNPGGRPAGEAEVRSAAREHTEAALGVLVAAMAEEDPRVRVTAANSLLDRGWGKPAQTVNNNVTRGDKFLTVEQAVNMAEEVIEESRRSPTVSGELPDSIRTGESPGLQTG